MYKLTDQPTIVRSVALLFVAAVCQPVMAQIAQLPGVLPEPTGCECRLPDMPPDERGLYVANLWTGGVVPYQFELLNAGEIVTPENQLRTRAAMDTLEAVCNVHFVPRSGQTDFLEIRNGTSNFSSRIGRGGGEQYITIWTWESHFTIVHELMHVLGAWHEQQRGDRDQYVTINYNNIPTNRRTNFDVRAGTIFGPYDFDSVMHYARFSMTANGLPTIETKPGYERWKYRLGPLTRLSTGDIWLLTEMYGGPRPPGIFELIAPTEGAVVGDAWTPEFAWGSAELADSYRLLVDEDPYFESPLIDVTVAGTTYSAGTLPAGKVYFWTVQAQNATGITQPWHTPAKRFFTGTVVPALVYVDDSAPSGGDGSSWELAFNDLQQALDMAACAAGAASEIRVAQGVYRPDRGSGDRSASFIPLSNVSIRGGYAGYGAVNPDLRESVLLSTVLSGDLAGDDGPSFSNNAENSIHVIWMAGQRSGPVVIDGVTVSGGNADGAYVWSTGAGAGLWADDCEIQLIDCNFVASSTSLIGGGARFQACDVRLQGCTFSDNRALPPYTGLGGGLIASYGSNELRECMFQFNEAVGGGGAYFELSTLEASDSCWLLNTASQRPAGGLWVVSSSASVANSSFLGNVAVANPGGGAVVAFDSDANFKNCIFSGNRQPNAAGSNGGGLWVGNGLGGPSSATLSNCTFSGNESAGGGGAIGVTTASSVTASNCVLFGNLPGQIALTGSSMAALTHSNVQGGWPGVGNIDADPLFADADGPDNAVGTADDDLRLVADSPCIDAGDPAFLPDPCEHDLDDACRVWDVHGAGPRVDMGAYEFGSPLGDLDGDCSIGLSDLTTLLANFGTATGARYADGDLNRDAAVDLNDLTEMLSSFGSACP